MNAHTQIGASKIDPDLKIVSVDSHVLFTDEWVTERLPSALRQMYVDAGAAYRKDDVAKRKGWTPNINDLFDEVAWNDPGHTDPVEKLKSMDKDGIYSEVIFPEVGAMKFINPKYMGDNWEPVLSHYNDAMADFASVDKQRLMCAYQLIPFDIDKSIAEVERLAKIGARCVQLPCFPTEVGLKDYCDPYYHKLWGVLQETGITILNHLDTNLRFYNLLDRDPTEQRAVAMGMPPLQMAETVSLWILPGTLELFPNLKVLFVEPGLGWLPFLFETILDGRIKQGHYKFPHLSMLPSEYFKRQMGATFMYEPHGLKTAYEYFGPDCIYWSTDFPHPATSWPKSLEHIDHQFAEAGIPPEDTRKIISENGMRLFGL
jgi:predicted TIM-barrel fold metal-dependent hydrolase